MREEKARSKMSPEERAQRRAAVGKAASEKVSKSEQLNFRIEEQAIAELQELALSKGTPVGTMIRDWVMERLSQEKFGTPDMTGRALHVLDEFRDKVNCLFGRPGSQKLQQQNESMPLVREAAPQYGQGEQHSAVRAELAERVGECLALYAAPEACASASKSTSSSELQLEHLQAWEHVLVDHLSLIRQQRVDLERRSP